MGKRVPPGERTNQQIHKMRKEGSTTGEIRREFVRLAVRKLIEEALEAEVADVLGRQYYERPKTDLSEHCGTQTGYGRLLRVQGPSAVSARVDVRKIETFGERGTPR